MSNECKEMKWKKYIEEEARLFALVMAADWGLEKEQS